MNHSKSTNKLEFLMTLEDSGKECHAATYKRNGKSSHGETPCSAFTSYANYFESLPDTKCTKLTDDIDPNSEVVLECVDTTRRIRLIRKYRSDTADTAYEGSCIKYYQ